jgi:hypothetical protein
MTTQSETVGETRKDNGSHFEIFMKKLTAAVGLIGGLIGLLTIVWVAIHPNVAGHWSLGDKIEKSTDPSYIGKTVTYDIFLMQDGTSLTGSGERMAQDGVPLPTKQRTHIDISGSVGLTSIDAIFKEQGTERISTGAIHLRRKTDGTWADTFESDVAGSSGSSSIKRVGP